MNAEVPFNEARRAERIAIEAEVRSRHAGGKPYPTSLRNLSPGGCCIELPYQPALGERLWVTLPGLQPLEAEVCWTDKFLAGCAFKVPLYPAVFDHLRQRMGR
ncbi:PilZ domain-containing protein [Sphingomicrobium astaxanthinifaciens]|uniref:PilZ domain-containing protein n=1 Tax=Sphingomicrobium astaxanthinifaciens TaxID=1227949 RepID=UPI001FCC7A05|nr:PilZ domain-containing protein [Sphingomicrobium astaxanthinifaciens]MCJ7421545.1 PilZ domain-containing protein [Sphingomicrobium astaxanthinifaciens]